MEHWRELVRATYAGRHWLVATDVLVSATSTARRLLDDGAASCFALGASRGAGDLDEGVPHAVLDVSGTDMMDGIRRSMAALRHLPDDVVAGVDAWDPAREARAITTIFDPGTPIAGRSVWGARQPAWCALEDKTVIDAVWDAAGIARAPSRVVHATGDTLRAAARAVDLGAGTVWAADNREGWHGGASYLRWVRSEADASEAADYFATCANHVRVMPFLEGIPCSIHGWVFPDGAVIALRPCEMVVFRRPGSSRFAYGRAATFWDPAPADRAEMREVARRVGAWLRDRHGYRGSFTVDGVMSREGFRPTELNPRFGAGLSMMQRGLGVDLYLLHLATVEGVDADWRAPDLEAALVASADANRAGAGGAVLSRPIAETSRHPLALSEGRWVPTDDEDRADAVAMLGPHPAGGWLNVRLNPDTTPIGPSVAPRIAAVFAALDALHHLGIGPLEPATPVR